MCLFGASKLLLARYRALFPTQSRFDALGDTGFSGALNRQTTDMQRLLPLRIGPSRALWALIGLQTNAGSRQFVRGGFPLGNHREKIVSFLSDAGHFGAFGWHEPLLSRRAHPVSDVWMQDNSASCMHQIKSDSALDGGDGFTTLFYRKTMLVLAVMVHMLKYAQMAALPSCNFAIPTAHCSCRVSAHPCDMVPHAT